MNNDSSRQAPPDMDSNLTPESEPKTQSTTEQPGDHAASTGASSAPASAPQGGVRPLRARANPERIAGHQAYIRLQGKKAALIVATSLVVIAFLSAPPRFITTIP